MDKTKLVFLMEKIHALAFMNPFGRQRDKTESEIIERLGWVGPLDGGNPIFTDEFNQVLYWVGEAEELLLSGESWSPNSKLEEERLASLAYFSLYHKLVDDLDRLVAEPGDPIRNRKLFARIEGGIRLRQPLVGGGRSPLWEDPAHLFACFYQLRRAFLCLFEEIVGGSEPIRALRMRVWESIFTQDMLSYQQWMHESVGRFPTLVLGPSGSGKEIVARAIGLSRFVPYDVNSGQFASIPRTSFRPVNLSALSETLIESELFGHMKGAFTGAISDHAGIFEKAGRYGTVFLDEIGEVPESIQVKLLRILQSGEFQPIGGSESSYFEGKIIAATHRDMSDEMKSGRIREDFYYRLCGDQVRTVALCEILASKPDELIASVHYICRKLFGMEGAGELASKVVETLVAQVPVKYKWPGNFRELEQAVRNVIVRDEYSVITKESPEPLIEEIYSDTKVTLAEWNRLYASRAFVNAGSYREAARRLGIDQRTLKKIALS